MAKIKVKKYTRKIGRKRVKVKQHSRKKRGKYPKRPFKRFTHKKRFQKKDRFGRWVED